MIFRPLFIIIPLLCVALTGCDAPDERAAVQENVPIALTAHQARYDIKMVSKRSGSQLLNIGGTMTFEWRPTCEGWIADHNFDLLYEYTNNSPVRIVSDFATYESRDGQTFSYSTRRQHNGMPYELLRGHAKKDGDGQGGEAVYRTPEELSFTLTPDTLFPMAHTLALIQHARAGDRFFSATIFDGSDEEGPVNINAFIGHYHPATTLPLKADAKDDEDIIDRALLAAPAWDMRLAVFPTGKDAPATADYEMDLTLHDNGIIGDMLVEYDDFSVTQTLTALKKGDEISCP